MNLNPTDPGILTHGGPAMWLLLVVSIVICLPIGYFGEWLIGFVLSDAFVGAAVTCHCGPADNLALFGALDAARAGDILMVATDGFTGTAVTGDLVMGMARNRGVARRLVEAVSAWASARGCRELASDTSPGNLVSQSVHRNLGFVETERAVFYSKSLGPQRDH